MNNYGWISIHRKLLDNPISNKPNYLAVWLYLLLKCNHENKEIIWNNQKILIKRGQFIGSISQISQHFNLSTGTITYILNYLISEKMIEKSSTMKFTVFTVLNYDQYQEVEKKVEKKLKTNEKEVETNNNDNNEKNDNKILTLKNFISKKKEILQDVEEKYPTKKVSKAIDDFIEWCQIHEPKYKNYKLAFMRWVREDKFNKYTSKEEIEMSDNDIAVAYFKDLPILK